MPLTTRGIRRLWFLGAWLLLPWPMILWGDQFVPAVRYLILAAAASAIAVTEGAAGPVKGIVILFVGWGLVTTALCWLLAWLASKLLSHLPPRYAGILTLALLAIGLITALLMAPYETRFGRSATGGLLDILS